MISVEKLKNYTRIRATASMLDCCLFTGEPRATSAIVIWLEANSIWEWSLIGEPDGDHGPCYFFVFEDAQDASMFALRWS